MWNLKKYKNNIAMITDDGITYTYHQLDQLQQEFAAKVQYRKLGFIICTNAVACVVAYVSCITNKIPIMLVSEDTINITNFGMYYEETANQIIVEYEEEYQRLDLYYRYDDNNFICIEDFDMNTYLELPQDGGYLDGYLVVYDKLGNKLITDMTCEINPSYLCDDLEYYLNLEYLAYCIQEDLEVRGYSTIKVIEESEIASTTGSIIALRVDYTADNGND